MIETGGLNRVYEIISKRDTHKSGCPVLKRGKYMYEVNLKINNITGKVNKKRLALPQASFVSWLYLFPNLRIIQPDIGLVEYGILAFLLLLFIVF